MATMICQIILIQEIKVTYHWYSLFPYRKVNKNQVRIVPAASSKMQLTISDNSRPDQDIILRIDGRTRHITMSHSVHLHTVAEHIHDVARDNIPSLHELA